MSAEGSLEEYESLKFDPPRLAHEIESRGRAYAEAKSAFEALDRTRAAYLAKLTNDVRKEQADFSRKEAEDVALGSDAYSDHLGAIVDAEKEMIIKRARYEAAKALVETLRTAEATKRFQSNLR
jgi:hypothetical protein